MTIRMVVLLFIAASSSAAPRSQGTPGEFDFYVLSLSWSPTFCLTHPDNEQCSGKGYGFVLHGLWPQYARGGWPASCEPQSQLSAEDMAKGDGEALTTYAVVLGVAPQDRAHFNEAAHAHFNEIFSSASVSAADVHAATLAMMQKDARLAKYAHEA